MTDRLLDIPVQQVVPNPQQPRTVFDEAEMQELAATIRKHGLIQRIIVVPNGEDQYMLLTGERRWRATQLVGLETIPAIVRERVDEQTMAEIALIENIQRKNLSAAEEARAYEHLATQYNLSNEQIAQRVGKDRATVANLRGLLRLPKSVLDMVGEGEGQIPQGVARNLAQVAKFPKAHKDIEALAKQVAKGKIEPDGIEEGVDAIVDHYARAIAFDWDTHWLSTPREVTDDQGAFTIGACALCPHFVTLHRDRFCAAETGRCYFAKATDYARLELERVSKATHIPVAVPEEKVTVLEVEYRHQARVHGWLHAKQRPDHLRLIFDIERRPTYTTKELLRSDVVLLASTDPQALTRAAEVPVKTATETPAQKAKREAAEEQARAERRAEKVQKRQAQYDIDWLGLNAARMVSPQITASGVTLKWLAAYVSSHSPIGPWPAMRARVDEINKLLEQVKGQPREALLKEYVLVHLIGHRIASTYDPNWHENWENALANLKEVVTDKTDAIVSDGLGFKLPAGWNKPPIHQTESNCWHCGRFASMEHLTKRDLEEGWHVVTKDGATHDVICPDCAVAKAKKPSAKGKR